MKGDSESTRINVYFSKRKVGPQQLPESGIVITPTADAWNDFSLRTRFDYVIRESGEALDEGMLFLSFIDSSESAADRVTQLLRASPEPLRPANDFPEFFTLLPSMQAYRTLVRKLGPTTAQRYLRAINDMVVVQRRKSRPAWFTKARGTLAFQRSFMRNSESFFSFHNAVSILGGLRNETFSGLSRDWRLRFKLPTFHNTHELEFSFTNDEMPPRRIVVVIGENGTGKSRALHNLVASALVDDVRLRTADGGRPAMNRLLAIESPGETHATFPAEKVGGASKVEYRRVAWDRNGKRGLGRGVTSLFVRLARSEDRIGDKTRWQLFQDAVGRLIPFDQVHVRLKRASQVDEPPDNSWPGRVWIPLSRLGYGGSRDLLDLWARVDPSVEPRREAPGGQVPFSSGQITYIRFAAQLCLNVENGTLVLLDEPETHLHPSLVTEFVALLSNLLKATGSFAVISTHSSYFVRESPASQVIVLREAEPGQIQVTKPRLRTLGADVGAISRFVFGDKIPSLVLSEIRETLPEDPRGRRRALDRLRNLLPTEAQMYLARVPSSPTEDR